MAEKGVEEQVLAMERLRFFEFPDKKNKTCCHLKISPQTATGFSIKCERVWQKLWKLQP